MKHVKQNKPDVCVVLNKEWVILEERATSIQSILKFWIIPLKLGGSLHFRQQDTQRF